MSERQFNPYAFHTDLTKKLIALAAICDQWDQLTILSEIADLFYKNVDPEYQELYKQFESSARRLQKLTPAGPHWDQSDQGDLTRNQPACGLKRGPQAGAKDRGFWTRHK